MVNIGIIELITEITVEEVPSPDWSSVLLGLGTLFVSALAAAYAIREHRNSRENLIHEMRAEWNKLQPSWKRILMAEHGANFHYVDASKDERKKAARIYFDLRTDFRDSYDRGYEAALSVRSDVRAVMRFLTYAADSVLIGKWRMSEAYEVFGPDVARHHETIRMLAHCRNDIPGWLEQALEFNTFDEHNCVFLFAFFMRAEQCRRGDTYAHFAIELAKEMRGSYKKQLRHSIHNVLRTRKRLTMPLHIRVLLWRGRNPNVRTTYGLEDHPIIAEDEKLLLKRLGEPRWLLNYRIERARNLLAEARADYYMDAEVDEGQEPGLGT